MFEEVVALGDEPLEGEGDSLEVGELDFFVDLEGSGEELRVQDALQTHVYLYYFVYSGLVTMNI